METTEDPKRRGRYRLWEGAVIIGLGLAMLLQSWYFNEQDQEQRRTFAAGIASQQQCLSDNFAELSKALDARSALAAKETAQNKKLWLVQSRAAGLLPSPDGELTPEQQADFQREYVRLLLQYQDVIEGIEQERRDHPLPDYPSGECERR